MKKTLSLVTTLTMTALLSMQHGAFAAPTMADTRAIPCNEYEIEEETAAEAELSASVTASGTCGDNLTWTLYEDGKFTISGSGDMQNFDNYYFYSPWYDYNSSIKTVILSDGITSIGDCAFRSCCNLTSITIPDSVTYIGSRAFRSCSSLTSITIPDGVTSIGWEAFCYCSLKGSITIPDGVTTIEQGTFNGCSLTSVKLPNGITGIDSGAFRYCRSLASINIPDGVTYIGGDAFEYCGSLTSIMLPDSLITIGARAFGYCGLTTITIPDGVDSIGVSTFEYCKNLTSITIPKSVGYIGESAFKYCTKLTSITIPGNLRGIAKKAFYGCENLTSVAIQGRAWANDSDVRIYDEAFSGCKSLTSINIPDGVTSIGIEAFRDCNLTSITIPGSVESIGEIAFYGCNLTSATIYGSKTSIGWNAFYHFDNNFTIYCHAGSPAEEYEPDGSVEVSFVTFDGTVASGECGNNLTWTLDTDGVLTISGNGNMYDYDIYSPTPWDSSSVKILKISDGVTSIGDYAFFNCDNLTSVTISDSVKSIGDYAFAYCRNLTSTTISDGVTSIGDNAFCHCYSLTSITIPGGIKSIGSGAFEECSSLTSINVDENNEKYCSIDGNLFTKDKSTLIQYAIGKEDTQYVVPSGVTNIGNRAFFGSNWDMKLKSITMPESVKSIGDYAFATPNSARSRTINITILNSEARIGEGAFDNQYYPYITIYGYTGSTAEAYAKKENISFVAIDATLPGDLSGDGEVTSEDAIYLLYHTFWPEEYPINVECDYNGDGEINSEDAIYLLFYTFWPEEYPLLG